MEHRRRIIVGQAVARAMHMLRPNPEGLDEHTLRDVATAAATVAAELVAADLRAEAALVRAWHDLRLNFEDIRPRPVVIMAQPPD